MNNLFNTPTVRNRRRSFDPTFKYISDTVRNNLNLVKRRIYQSARYVRPDHVLYRLLVGLSINRQLTLAELTNAVSDVMYQVGNSCGLSSAVNTGTVHRNMFMDGCSEVVFIHNDDFDIEPWYKLEPVKFYYHCETNINAVRGGGLNKEGIAIIGINVPMLAYMYVKWAAVVEQLGSTENTYNFLAKYVLTNALPSYINISYFNRYFFTELGRDVSTDPRNPEMALGDVTNQSKKQIARTLEDIAKGYSSIGSVLYSTQIPLGDSALDLYDAPKLPYTRQITWVVDVYRLPYILYGLLISNRSGHNQDSGVLTTLGRDLDQMLNTKILQRLHAQFSTYILEHFLGPLQSEIKTALGKK